MGCLMQIILSFQENPEYYILDTFKLVPSLL